MTTELSNTITSLVELRRFPGRDTPSPWHAQVIQRDIGGGKTTLAELDQLSSMPAATALTVSGLDQAGLEHLAKRFSSQFTAIHFWKCPRIADLSPMEDMPQLTHVAFFWNQRATRLWDFTRTPNLRGLHFDDFTKLKDLNDVSAASSLDELGFGNAVWNKYVVASLEPLAVLSSLRSLNFNAKRVVDGRIQPLALLAGLTELEFPSNLFSTEQLAWLRARLPASVRGSVLEPYRTLRNPIARNGKNIDTVIMGKGKPLLDSTADASRLQRYVADYGELVERYSRDDGDEP